MNLLTFMLAVISVTLNALAQIALRKTMQTLGAFPQSASDYLYFGYQLILNAWFITGMCLYAISIGSVSYTHLTLVISLLLLSGISSYMKMLIYFVL